MVGFIKEAGRSFEEEVVGREGVIKNDNFSHLNNITAFVVPKKLEI